MRLVGCGPLFNPEELKQTGCFGCYEWKGAPVHYKRYEFSFWGKTESTKTEQDRIWIQKMDSFLGRIAAIVKKCLLGFSWQEAYLDPENGTPPEKVLVSARVSGDSREDFKQVLGRSLEIAKLYENGAYERIFGQEFLLTHLEDFQWTRIQHPLGNWCGSVLRNTNRTFHPIYRATTRFSTLGYFLRKNFSSSWTELKLKVDGVVEKILVQKRDKAHLEIQFSPFA